MKKNFITFAAAAALLVASAAVVPAEATEAEGESTEVGMLMPTPKKKTTKKSTSKKSTSKKSTKSTTKKSSTTSSKKSTAKAAAPAEAETETTTDNSSEGSSVLGSVLGGILGGSSSSNGGGLASALSTIFDNSKVATADRLVGTWKYTEPAVVFESSNALKNIGGKVASAAIEKKLQTQLEKFGVKKGKFKMTFDKDGNFTQTLNGKTLSGTYTTSGKQVVLTYTGGIKQIAGTTQLDGNSLLIVMDASKLMKFAGTLGKLTGNSTVSTLSNLLGSYDGMEVGIKLEK